MSTITDKKITDGQRNAVWVQHQQDRLTGTPQQNKAVFDEYSELIRAHFNDAMDAIDERISTNDSDIEELKEINVSDAAESARESAEIASESAQTTQDMLGRVISISNKIYTKSWDVEQEQDEFVFSAEGYTYNESDTYEVFVNGLKLSESEYTRNEDSVVLGSSISTGNTVEIIVTTNLKGKGIVDTELNDDYTLTINYDDGTSMTTDSIRGEKGEKGDTGDAVSDGSLTEVKFTDALKKKTIKDYVTPEMFGAVGDGVTDDTQSFVDALATGKTVVGLVGSIYHVKNLNVDRGTICKCVFKGTSTEDCILLGSHSLLYGNTFTQYGRAIISRGITVHSFIVRNIVQYCNNGIYFELLGNNSANNVMIDGNYFVKCGSGHTDDMSYPYLEDGTGYGVFLDGNWCGVNITNNVFEYNGYCGVCLRETSLNYSPFANVDHNYFEGNKNSAIYVEMLTSVKAGLYINNNFYSSILTNVSYTRYVNFVCCRSYYEMRDLNRIFGYFTEDGRANQHILDVEKKQAILTAQNASTIYLGFMPASEYNSNALVMRLTYYATNLETDIELRKSDNRTVLGTFTNGSGEMVCEYNNGFCLQRALRNSEKITILDVRLH